METQGEGLFYGCSHAVQLPIKVGHILAVLPLAGKERASQVLEVQAP